MTIEQAKSILGNQAEWELKHMIKALNMFSILNTPEDNQRLKAARVILADMRKRRKL